jgi:hypothetical protein
VTTAGRRRVLLGLGAAAVAGAAALRLTGSTAFQPYYGSIDPVLGTAGVVAVALLSLRFLERDGWLFVDRAERGRARFAVPAAVATLLAIPVVVVDWAGGFPQDINVLPPQSLLFYPVIALVAETVFHVLPIALLAWVTARAVDVRDRRMLLVALSLVASLPEPVFQVVAGAGESPPWASAFVGVHLWIFNLFAVYLFNRNGFFSMLAFRLCYYAWWHLVWGVLRLRLLF